MIAFGAFALSRTAISPRTRSRYNGVVHERPPRIQIGHSALFRTPEGLSNRLAHSSEPVELVFPAREDEYLPLLNQLDEIAERALLHDPGVLSIHAPPLRMDSGEFPETALSLARLAETLGARSVTFHPTKCRRIDGFEAVRAASVANIRRAQERTAVALSVETLGHRRCILDEDDISRFGLPMVLDTTHVGWEASARILREYHPHIRMIHLSERTADAHHQRIGQSSFDFVAKLVETGWSGSVILEYWPWRWRCYPEDVATLAHIVMLSSIEHLRR